MGLVVGCLACAMTENANLDLLGIRLNRNLRLMAVRGRDISVERLGVESAGGASRPLSSLVRPQINARLVTDGPSHRRACLTGYTDSEKATGPLKGFRAFWVFLAELCALVA